MDLWFDLYYYHFIIIICGHVSSRLLLYLLCHYTIIVVVSTLHLVSYSCHLTITMICFVLFCLVITICVYVSSSSWLYFSCRYIAIIVMSALCLVLCSCRLAIAVWNCFFPKTKLYHHLVYSYLSICQLNTFFPLYWELTLGISPLTPLTNLMMGVILLIALNLHLLPVVDPCLLGKVIYPSTMLVVSWLLYIVISLPILAPHLQNIEKTFH